MKIKFDKGTAKKGSCWFGVNMGHNETEHFGVEIFLFKWSFLIRLLKESK